MCHTTGARGATPTLAMSCVSAQRAWHHPGVVRVGKTPKVSRRGRFVRAATAASAGDDGRPNKNRVAVFVSGGGSNLRALHAAMQDGSVDAQLAVVVSNALDCGGVLWAQENNIPTLRYPPTKQDKADGVGLTPELLVVALDELNVGFVCLAGYLRLIPPALCQRYEKKMLNIHPALLPAFGGKGMHGNAVHAAVVASGARVTGPTIHFVTEQFDEGKILAQLVVPVFPTDSVDDVAHRVLKEEHRVFPHALSALVDGRVEFREDGVPKIKKKDGDAWE